MRRVLIVAGLSVVVTLGVLTLNAPDASAAWGVYKTGKGKCRVVESNTRPLPGRIVAGPFQKRSEAEAALRELLQKSRFACF